MMMMTQLLSLELYNRGGTVVRYGGTCLDCVVLCIRTRIVSGTLRHRNSDYFCSRSFELVECWGCHFHNHYTTSERIRMRMSPPHKDLLCRMLWKGGHALGVYTLHFRPIRCLTNLC